MPDFRFPAPSAYGEAREILDPAGEAARLAGNRKAAETVTIPRPDLAVLVALAGTGAWVNGGTEDLPAGVTMDDAVRVLERYASE